ncbi:DUF1963 domain-containing protein [Umezawaea tangerina]|nr:DUF1963 domain-containing protein [Umezawaea tangerina]
MASMDPFRDEARNRGVPEEEVERWLGTVRPCATLDSTDDHADGPPAGRVGGPPPLPDGVPAPTKPFLAVVDLAAVPADATDLPLPPDGTLLFFADTEDPGPGEDWFQVVYVPAGTPVSTTDSGAGESYPVADLRLKVEPSLPNRVSSTEEFPHGFELGSVWWKTCSRIQDGGIVELGGYPWVWNWDPVADHDHDPDDDWVLLASINGKRLSEGDDLGLINWVVPRADLAARRFDRVEAYYDQAG